MGKISIMLAIQQEMFAQLGFPLITCAHERGNGIILGVFFYDSVYI